jgi:hypothetical protein
MREGLFMCLLAAAAAGCASAGGVGGASAGARAPAPRIVVGAQSNVCVSIRVDQRVWPRPLDAETERNLSGGLMSELRALFEQRGGVDRIPGTDERFGTDTGTNPFCRDAGTDVFVELRYRPRADGTPFVADYRVWRGAAVRAGSAESDVAEEIRSGRIPGYTQRRTLATVMGNHMAAQAPIIMDMLTIAPGARSAPVTPERGG